MSRLIDSEKVPSDYSVRSKSLNLDFIAIADRVIYLGQDGGKIIFEGRPEKLAKCRTGKTGKILGEKMG